MEVLYKKEEETLSEVITAARTIQDFLWGEFNQGAGLEEYKRMFRKRMVKIEDINLENPYWKIELKKRLLQIAAISVNLITKIDNNELTHSGIHTSKESNLKTYSAPLKTRVTDKQISEAGKYLDQATLKVPGPEPSLLQRLKWIIKKGQ